jgi:hypothetical protein
VDLDESGGWVVGDLSLGSTQTPAETAARRRGSPTVPRRAGRASYVLGVRPATGASANVSRREPCVDHRSPAVRILLPRRGVDALRLSLSARRSLDDRFAWSEPLAGRHIGLVPRLDQRRPIEETERNGDHEEHNLVDRAGDRCQPERGEPAEWPGDARVGRGDSDRSKSALEEFDPTAHVPSLGPALIPLLRA